MVLFDQVIEAKVVDVIWSASKDGYLKPRVRIEPVKIPSAVARHPHSTATANANPAAGQMADTKPGGRADASPNLPSKK